ncbi:MAG TPA: hypothetical protein VGE90_10900 [Chitinophaga sp.]
MDDKHSHIEDWLRKAAAQQAAPEDTGGELKRQSWSKMAALLDEDAAGKPQPQPRVFRMRFNWAAIIIPFVATAAVFAATVWVVPHFSKKTTTIGKPSNAKEHPQQTNKQTRTQEVLDNNNIPGDSTFININGGIPQPMPSPADSITGFAGTIAGAPDAGGVPSQIEPALPLPENRRGSAANNNAAVVAGDKTNGDKANNTSAAGGGIAHSTTGKLNSTVTGPTTSNVGSNNKTAGNKPVAAGAKEKNNITTPTPANGNTSVPAAGNKKNLPHNKVNKTSTSGIANDNEPVADEQTATGKRFLPGTSGKAGSTAAGTTMLYPVRTRNVFALQLPSLSDNSREARVPASASGSGGLSLGASESRWGLQVGLLSPLSSALGIRAGVLYIYPLGNNWFLQPQLSASYLTGYDKAFTHVAVSKHLSDTAVSGSQDRYDVDTTSTPYTFKRAFAGSAGINVGYHRNKLAVSTGLVYSMAMASGKQDSARVRSGVVQDTTVNPAQFTDPAFSPGRLPGKSQLSWNIDLSWYVTPRIQAGFNYRVVLWRSAGDKGFQAPLQRIQDNSLLELYIRIPIGKK